MRLRVITRVFCLSCVLSFFSPIGCWTYSGNQGPRYWKNHYPACGQNQQSPINIYEGDVQKDSALENQTVLFQNYDTVVGVTMMLENNGHSAVVNIAGETEVAMTSGGLPGVFRAIQFHFHWGRTSYTGSEHFINTLEFPMELHIVHYNTKYRNVSVAMNSADGLAVLGYMFEVSKFNPNYSTIVSNLPRISAPGATAIIPTVLMSSLLPQRVQKFYRYSGSLTTPSCQESVTWTVFPKTIKISETQLQSFRSLLDEFNGPLVDNYRPVQPLNARTVTANFDPDINWGYVKGHVNEANWRHYYSKCDGESQSPVNIAVKESHYDATIGSFTFNNYANSQGFTMMLKNNGHSAQVDIAAGDASISGAGLPETYKVAQIHMHWGSSDMKGSEHTVNSRPYPLEVHIVHFRSSLGKLSVAASVPDGLAVLGIFSEISGTDNQALKPIIDQLRSIRIPGTSQRITAFTISSILPADTGKFFRYSGSLTTPGCFETVIWSVFNDTVKISPSQLAAFRNLWSSETDAISGSRIRMVDNFRPVQNLNHRVVRNNFIKAQQQSFKFYISGGSFPASLLSSDYFSKVYFFILFVNLVENYTNLIKIV